MFVLGLSVNWVDEYPVMEFDVAGTTGNLYKVTVGKVPFCSCPDSLKGNQCKHIFYGTSFILTHIVTFRLFYCYSINMAYQVLVNALKAPAHLQYQLAFLSTVGLSSCRFQPTSRAATL